MVNPQDVRNLVPRNLSAILDETFAIYGRNFLGLIGVAAFVAIPLSLLQFLYFSHSFSLDVFAYILSAIASIIFTPIMEGSLVYAISIQHFHKTIDIGQAYSFAWSRKSSLIIASLIVWVAFILMFIIIIGIPFAIFFGVRWSLIIPVALLENVGPTEAISRSSNLVSGNWWRVFGYIILIFIIGFIIGMGAFFITAFMPNFLAIIVQSLINLLTLPIGAAIITLLYYDLRLQKEGYNLEKLSQELGLQDTHQHYSL